MCGRITSKVMSSISVHVEVYSIQHPISSTNKPDRRHAITEILLKVARNTILPYTFINTNVIWNLTIGSEYMKFKNSFLYFTCSRYTIYGFDYHFLVPSTFSPTNLIIGHMYQ